MYYNHFKRDLQINYEPEKLISFKANKHKGKLLGTPTSKRTKLIIFVLITKDLLPITKLLQLRRLLIMRMHVLSE